MGVHLGVELTVTDGVEELLRNGELDERILLRRTRDGHIDGIRLGGEDLSLKTVLGEVDNTTGGLVDSDSGDLDGDLNLDARAVDNLAGRDGLIEDNVGLLARVEGEGVELTFNLDGGTSALVDVDSLLVLSDGDGNRGGLVLDDPLVSLELKLGRLSGDGSSVLSEATSRLGLDLLDLTRAISAVLGLHIGSNLTQTRSNALTLVELSKDARHIGTIRRGSRGSGARGRRRGSGSRGTTSGRSGGGRSSGSSGSGRSSEGRGLATLGIPGRTSGVVSLDVVSEGTQEAVEVTDPLDLLLILTLLLAQDLVGVIFRGSNGLLDVGDRSRGHTDPHEGTASLTDSRQVDVEGRRAVVSSDLLDGLGSLTLRSGDLHEDIIGRLLGSSDSLQDAAMSSDQGLESSGFTSIFFLSKQKGRFSVIRRPTIAK